MLHQLAVAFCLMLVIEGMLPFIAPGRWRRMLEAIEQVDDSTLRLVGFASMLAGTALLYLVN
jgi:uncharacterized protein YjeT (DUF2065 family)